MPAKHKKLQAASPASSVAAQRRDMALYLLVAISAWSSFFALPFATGTNTGRVFAVLVGAAGWLTFAAFGAGFPVNGTRRPFAIALGLLTAAVFVASALSPYAARALTWGSISFFGAPVWLALAVIALFAAVVLESQKWRAALAVSVAWVVPSLGLAAYQIGSGVPATGGFNTGNHFGVMLVVAAPVIVWLAATSTGTERSAWHGLTLGCVAGVVLSQSSAALLGLSVTAFSVTLMAPGLIGDEGSKTRSVIRGTVWSITALFAATLIVGLAVPQALPDAAAAYLRGDVLGTTFLTRVEMWRAAAEVFMARPLTGFGADSYHLAAQPHLSQRLFSLETGRGVLAAPPDPHSLPMLFAAQFGLLGLVAGVGVLVTWMRSSLTTTDAESTERFLLRRAAAAGSLGFLVAMIFVPWAVIMGGFPALVAGLAVLPGSTEGDARRLPLFARIGAGLVAAALGVLAIMLLVGVSTLDTARNAANSTDAQAKYRAAADTLPSYPYARLMVLHVEGAQLGGSPEQVTGWQERVDADSDMAVDATYSLLLLRDSLDQAYRWGRTDVSWEEQRLREAVERFPNAPDAALETAHYLIAAGELANAERALDAAEKTAHGDSRLALYRYYLAVERGNSAEAAALRAQLEAEYGPQALLDPQAPATPATP